MAFLLQKSDPRIDLTQFAGRYQPSLALGWRAGSSPAVIGTGAFVVIAAALAALFVRTFDGR